MGMAFSPSNEKTFAIVTEESWDDEDRPGEDILQDILDSKKAFNSHHQGIIFEEVAPGVLKFKGYKE